MTNWPMIQIVMSKISDIAKLGVPAKGVGPMRTKISNAGKNVIDSQAQLVD